MTRIEGWGQVLPFALLTAFGIEGKGGKRQDLTPLRTHDSGLPGAGLSTYADATPVADDAMPDCAGGEPFALLVLGASMEPEFHEGEIILIEPEGLVRDGCYVLAWHREEWTFRQLRGAAGHWFLHPLNPAFPDQALDDLSAVRGVIIQKALPGRRRASKTYS